MCIDDPLQHDESWFHHLFDTHPPLRERIAILERIAEATPPRRSWAGPPGAAFP
jgi:Zn-dependent protease with chaperone function